MIFLEYTNPQSSFITPKDPILIVAQIQIAIFLLWRHYENGSYYFRVCMTLNSLLSCHKPLGANFSIQVFCNEHEANYCIDKLATYTFKVHILQALMYDSLAFNFQKTSKNVAN